MFVLIVGAGRVGSAVAKTALAKGYTCRCSTRIRSRTSAWTPASRRAGRTPAGSSRSARRSSSRRSWPAGIDHADVFIASTDGDNTNLIIAQIAQKQFGVERVLARVMDPARAAWYGEQGLHTISPTQHAIEMFASAVDASVA